MKKAIIAMLVMVVGMVANVMAYEIRENPDRKISFGFNYDHVGTNSEYKFGSIKISDFTNAKSDSFLLDMKVPLSSMFTFGIRGGYLTGNNSIFTGEQVDSTGYNIGVGIRFYLQ